MGIPVVGGGPTPVNGLLMTGGRNHEHIVADLRTKALEITEIQTRASHRSVAKNYGNLDSEMLAERTTTVTTPYSQTAYTHDVGKPLFVNTSRADTQRLAALAQNASTTTAINLSAAPATFGLEVGRLVEINGESRTITAVGATSITIAALSTAPQAGAQILVKGRDIWNPHLTPVYALTDKYGSAIIDQDRYQVDQASGLVRYRPRAGSAGVTGIWHQEDATFNSPALQGKPYFFGRAIELTNVPKVLEADTVRAGSTASVINLSAAPATLGLVANMDVVIRGQRRTINAVGANSITLNAALTAAPPVGEIIHALPFDGTQPTFSDLVVTAPANISFQVEINGAVVGAASNGGSVVIPYFDNNPNNDSLKKDEGIDPDVYIHRFLKLGTNNISIKAIRTNSTSLTAFVRVERFLTTNTFNTATIDPTDYTGPFATDTSPFFNSVNITTNNSSTSANPLDWSASQHSVLGVAGKIEFELGDRIALEDVQDQVQNAIGVLETLTSVIADTDINQLNSLLSIIR